jgi:hypothetical protein
MSRRTASLLVRAALSAVLAAGALAGCSGDGADVDCNLDSCTVTMDRGVEANATVLGVEVKLLAVADDQVSLEVGGQKISVPVDATTATEVAGLEVQVQRVTGDQVVLKITRPS